MILKINREKENRPRKVKEDRGGDRESERYQSVGSIQLIIVVMYN